MAVLALATLLSPNRRLLRRSILLVLPVYFFPAGIIGKLPIWK